MKSGQGSNETRLKIGTVSRLTGLSVHVLRKWEERYGAVHPVRTAGGGRLYTRQDVQRLALIRRLTQAGSSLGEIANSSLESLESQARSLLGQGNIGPALDERDSEIHLGVVGDALPTILRVEAGAPGMPKIVASGDSMAALEKALGDRQIDLLVLECPTVHADAVLELGRVLGRFGARGAIAVYGFGSRDALDMLRRIGVALMRAPIHPTELHEVALGLMERLNAGTLALRQPPMATVDDAIPGPRFSLEKVAQVALSHPAMRCECPHHLADIIASLLAFERYSIECESRNAADAELHRFLAVTAGRSRAAFEQALVRVAEAEGIDLGA